MGGNDFEKPTGEKREKAWSLFDANGALNLEVSLPLQTALQVLLAHQIEKEHSQKPGSSEENATGKPRSWRTAVADLWSTEGLAALFEQYAQASEKNQQQILTCFVENNLDDPTVVDALKADPDAVNELPRLELLTDLLADVESEELSDEILAQLQERRGHKH